MPGSGCFIFAWVQFSRRTVVVVQTPGLLCADARTASSQTLSNGLCETTAINIYLISPHRSTVSQRQGYSSSSEFFVSFFKPMYGWCQGPPRFACFSYRPTHRCPRAEEREGEGESEMERGEGQTKSSRRCEETHTSLCFHLSAWWTIIFTTWLRRKRTHVFYTTVLGVMEINCRHKTP